MSKINSQIVVVNLTLVHWLSAYAVISGSRFWANGLTFDFAVEELFPCSGHSCACGRTARSTDRNFGLWSGRLLVWNCRESQGYLASNSASLGHQANHRWDNHPRPQSPLGTHYSCTCHFWSSHRQTSSSRTHATHPDANRLQTYCPLRAISFPRSPV